MLFLVLVFVLSNLAAFAQTEEEMRELKALNENAQEKGDDAKAYPVHATIGGDNVLGSLKIVFVGDNIQVYRNTSTSPETWQHQWYNWPDKHPSRSQSLFVNAKNYAGNAATTKYYVGGVAATAAESFFYKTSSVYYDRIDITKISQHKATVKMVKTGLVEVLLTVDYPKNADYIIYRWDIKNLSPNQLPGLRFFTGGDTYSYGSDDGVGYWDAATNTIGVSKNDGGTPVTVFIQGATTPYAWDSRHYFNITSSVTSATNPFLTKTVDQTVHDNGVALEWRTGTLAVGGTWTIESYEKYSNKVITNLEVKAPLQQTISPGTTINIIFTVTNKSTAAISNIIPSTLIDLAASGWTVSTSATPISLAAGETKNITVSVTCPTNAATETVAKVTTTATAGTVTANDIAYITVINSSYAVIETQPTSVTVCPGAATLFSVVASSINGVITYQWQSDVSGSWANLANDGVYSNVTTATLNISNITAPISLVGKNFRCIVTNTQGGIYTNEVTILSGAPIAPSSVMANGYTGTVSVGEGTGNVVLSYQGGSGTNFEWYLGTAGTGNEGTGNNVTHTKTAGTYVFVGRWENTCGVSDDLSVTVTVIANKYNISGIISYNNTSATVLAGQTVLLKQGGATLQTATTNTAGEYFFTNLVNGAYDIVPTVTLLWKGVTAMDVTYFKKDAASQLTPALSGVAVAAGDVNTGGITTSDYTNMLQRITTQISSFTAGDWCYSGAGAVTISGANLSKNIKALCFGDANGSYSFAAKNALNQIQTTTGQNIVIQENQNFEIPIILKTDINNLTSLTLEMNYNADLYSINSIYIPNTQFNYTVNNGTIYIAYSNINPISFMNNEIFIFIKATLNSKLVKQQPAVYNIIGELGNIDDQIIEDVILEIPQLAAENTTDLNNINNNINIYPNPANEYIWINNIENANVLITDILGNVLYININTQNAINIDTKNFATGTYFIKINKDNNVITRKFNVIR